MDFRTLDVGLGSSRVPEVTILMSDSIPCPTCGASEMDSAVLCLRICKEVKCLNAQGPQEC